MIQLGIDTQLTREHGVKVQVFSFFPSEVALAGPRWGVASRAATHCAQPCLLLAAHGTLPGNSWAYPAATVDRPHLGKR